MTKDGYKLVSRKKKKEKKELNILKTLEPEGLNAVQDEEWES